MTNPIQAVQGISAISASFALARADRLSQFALVSLTTPTLLESLDALSPASLALVNASLVTALAQTTGTVHSVTQPIALSATAATTDLAAAVMTANSSLPASLLGIPGIDVLGPAVTASPAAVGAEFVAAIVADGSANAAAANAILSGFHQDALAQAIANISTDPAYAATAASLYADAAIFHFQHAADAVLPAITAAIKPIVKASRVDAIP